MALLAVSVGFDTLTPLNVRSSKATPGTELDSVISSVPELVDVPVAESSAQPVEVPVEAVAVPTLSEAVPVPSV